MDVLVYLPNLMKNSGGAEVYGLWIAKVLSKTFSVKILTIPRIKEDDIENIFLKYGINNLSVLKLGKKRPQFSYRIEQKRREYLVNDYLKHNKCDLFINCGFNKMICRNCRNSIHIIHFPAALSKSIFGRKHDEQYIKSYNEFVANSEFTKKHLDQMYHIRSLVIHPPVTMSSIVSDELKRKENIILAVDRIVEEKKILEMIKTFECIHRKIHNNFKFVIVGNKDDSEINYYKTVIKEIKGYPIEIHTDVSYEELISWYKKSKIFWHAKGYGVSEENPHLMEHFGMTTVEAMTNGCIPVVINKAGQKEIMKNGLESLTWNTLEELKVKTIDLIEAEERISELQSVVIKEAEQYQIPQFATQINNIVNKVMNDWN